MRHCVLGLVIAIISLPCVSAEDEFVPRRQKKPPGPALTPQQAIEKMTVPEGFSVEVVASEPDILNPVAMAFDEQGRIWVTESFEYPRFEAGPGRDRIKVLEDMDRDGVTDKVTVFAEGLNIPSGIAVGHGGVWVANSPDILFLHDTDGDGKADKREVVVTGFGRDDTHELPNSLNWGPDGYLYGLNGVFNHSHVKQGGREFAFTCAMFRIDPRTREFEIFAEGTSNPWGIAWDSEGSAFISACVIDHLWHITESGYYHRQGGPYPPFTWKLESIVDYKHQLAAYCGIEYFDSDAYPEEYRDRLYMGNIHGGCINVDEVSRNGSTYRGAACPDFLTANDVWFMPVSQKVGPDGSLYVLDWYDRFHCYQDARAFPDKVDRGYGRLYRVRYKDTARATAFNLATESGDELIDRLDSPNVFFRSTAQRVLVERASDETNKKLEAVVLSGDTSQKTRMHALWSLVGQGKLSKGFHLKLLASGNPSLRAWGVRAAGNFGHVDGEIRTRVAAMAADESADVLLQVAIAAGKVESIDPLPVWVDVLANSGSDPLIPHIVWQNLHPHLPSRAKDFLTAVKQHDLQSAPNLKVIMPRVTERILANKK